MRTGLLIALCIIIGSTFSTFIAAAWTAPTASPPGNNVASPINTGATSQLKNGTLGVNALGVFGNTILSGTNGDNNGNGVNSYLNFGATAGQNGYGIRDNNGTLEFKNSSGSWGSLNVTLTNLLQVNGITTNGLGQITSIKFGDGTTQTTAASANPWATNGTSIYYNGGNVGIGTTNPGALLSLGNATNAQKLLLYDNATNYKYGFGIQANELRTFFPSDAGFMSFGTISTTDGTTFAEKVRITKDGNVGIGTANPITQLHLTGSEYLDGGAVFFHDIAVPTNPLVYMGSYNGNWAICTAATVNPPLTYTNCPFAIYNSGANAGSTYMKYNLQVMGTGYFGGATTVMGTGYFGGAVTAPYYYQSSDARLKKNIQTFADALQIVKQLRGVTFNWKKDETPSAGVIAQEVEKVMPSAVTTNPQTGMKSVEYNQLIAPVIEAIKEQQNQIDALTKKTDVQAQETDTQRLCIGSGATRTCITQQQLAALLASHAICKSQ